RFAVLADDNAKVARRAVRQRENEIAVSVDHGAGQANAILAVGAVPARLSGRPALTGIAFVAFVAFLAALAPRPGLAVLPGRARLARIAFVAFVAFLAALAPRPGLAVLPGRAR